MSTSDGQSCHCSLVGALKLLHCCFPCGRLFDATALAGCQQELLAAHFILNEWALLQSEVVQRRLCQRAINTMRSHTCRFIVSWPIFIGGILFTLGSACLLYESIMHHPNESSKDVSDNPVTSSSKLLSGAMTAGPCLRLQGLPAAACQPYSVELCCCGGCLPNTTLSG